MTGSGPRGERSAPWLGFAAVLTVRLAVFPFARNFYGDPMMRLKALTAWMAHPFFLKSFIGARQFGPLHIYLLALGQWMHADLDAGPRFISLIFGSLSAFPLYRLAERRFGRTAALLSTLGLAVYPLHIQASTTAASEAVFLWFLLWALAMLDEAPKRGRALLVAGLAMAGACAVRYDGWIYAPLSWIWLVEPLREKRIPRAAALGYAAASLAVPIFLCVGSWIDLRDPFYTLRYIQLSHFQSAAQAAAAMGRWPYAVYCLLFWPANLAWELTPPVALGVALGAAAFLRNRRGRDLLLLAALPAAVFSLEGALLLRFHPLARFTIPTGVLLLPYAGEGLLRAFRSVQQRFKPVAVAAAVLSGVGLPSYFAWRTLGQADWLANTLRPISPVSNLPPDLSAAAQWLKANGAARKVEIETNWLYEELPIEFYGSGTAAMVFTPLDGQAPKGFEPPDLVVLPNDSDVLRSGEAHLDGELLEHRGQRFSLLAHLGKVTVFERLQ